MSSILYGNFRLEVSGRTGSRLDRLAQRAPPGLLPRPVRAPGPAPAVPVGREEQVDIVRRSAAARRPVGFFGTCGYGKTTLLRYVAASAVAQGFAQPGVYLQAGPGGLRDLLHRLAAEFYTADQPVKLTPDECAAVLGQVQALVVLDDVALARGQADYLQTVLPGCSLVVGSRRPVLSQEDSHQLAGLSADAAVQLVIDELGRPLSASEMAGVRQLAAAVDGQPLHLRQATALAREGGRSFSALAEMAAEDPGALDRLSVNALAERYRRALAILAIAAGVLLPAGLVAAMGGIAEIGECLSLLHRRGLAEQRQDRFGLPVCKAESYRGMLVTDVHRAAALRELITWLTTRNPAAPDSISAASAALAIAEWAGEDSDWSGVIELVRVAEPILTLAGHWDAGRQLLSHGLHAAVAAGDHLSEALFVHQQGTLALCLDELTSAHQLLSRALRLREQYGDDEGAAVTRHNLQILQPPAPTPPRPPRRPRNLRRLTVMAASGAIAVLALTFGVIKALPTAHTTVSATGATPTPSPSASPHRHKKHKHHHTGAGNGGNTNGTGPGGATTPAPPPPPLKAPRLQPVSFAPTDISPGQPTSSQSVTVRNPNAQPLQITGAHTALPFIITADGCLASPIPPRNTCIITVKFAPNILGASAQSLTVTSAARSASTQLSGTGDAQITVNITGKGSGSVSGDTISCPNQCGETITAPASFPLTETPDAYSYFNGYALNGSCKMLKDQLIAGADCSVSADFEPIPIEVPRGPSPPPTAGDAPP